MLYNLNIEDVLFLDIETVPQQPTFHELPENFQKLWTQKSAYFRAEGQGPEDVYERAGIYAEFGRIICISSGVVVQKGGERFFRVKSFHDDDETKLLASFNNMLNKFTNHPGKCLCAHNGQEFDYPYIARRTLINGLRLPKILDLAGMKPWDVKDKLMDTLQLWKFGDYKNYTSLSLLCAAFNIPTPKDDIDGSQVAGVYYGEGDLDRIVRYCEKDTLAVANLLLRYKGEAIIGMENMEVV
ncbi:ribonuclease H-like domain-containing protein [Gaoshiqia sediminis]|uniref:Ribonuclease H-like domain-containing protein n=1 Tax=Gaoshiqia sediminis TaxID=2986998 RepID=A0AA41Y3V9_9BACT|nr:ribonuclease H-like domain-containing protein [Gaoshiqia sediminis]MCW0481404.1 ribonuclease H-like domain-containing protein [Gaoshiqia sediminis]